MASKLISNPTNMSKLVRYGIGAVVTGITVYDILTIKTLKFVEQGGIKRSCKILTITKLPFMLPKEGDLVLTLDNKKYEFKIVETTSGHYTDINKNGMSMLVPKGFLMLRDPETGVRSLECFGSVIGQINFDVTWMTKIFTSNKQE